MSILSKRSVATAAYMRPVKFDFFYFSDVLRRRGASDSVTDSSTLSNPADAQNVSYLGLCGRDICPKSSALYGPGTFNQQLLLFI